MKKLLLLGGAAAVLVVLGGLFFFFTKQNAQLVGDTLLASTFTSNGEPTGKVLLQVPFGRSLEASGNISIAVDTDSNGSFAENEYLVSDFPVRPQADWRNGYYAVLDTPLTDGMNALVVINGENHTASVQTKTFEVGELLDLATVTDPENATKGWGASVAYAQQDVEISQDGVPDLNQRKAECAPTAAANSLISLVAKNGGDDLIPGDPQDFIENLKRHMNWTPENGVPPDDFVAGKNRWAAAAGVPIRTTKVGDTHGITTIEAIREALENGDAVELRIKFANPGGTRVVGGHMVTVTGLHQDGDQTYIDINDPATPDSGTEIVEIQSNQITNYGPWQGITILSWGFVQTWEGHPTGTLLDTMTDEEIQGIRQFVGEEPQITVIEYNGEYIPASQLHVGDKHPPHASGEGCSEIHWHAAGQVTSLSGKKFSDPNPGGCGFGKLSEKPSLNIPAPQRNQPTE